MSEEEKQLFFEKLKNGTASDMKSELSTKRTIAMFQAPSAVKSESEEVQSVADSFTEDYQLYKNGEVDITIVEKLSSKIN